jgi:hypothetical protein
MHGPLPDSKRARKAWISLILAPAVVVGLATVAFAAPANAAEGDPSGTSAPATTSAPTDTPTTSATQTADDPTPPPASDTPASDAPASSKTDAPVPPVSDTPAATVPSAPVAPQVPDKSTSKSALTVAAPLLASALADPAATPTVTLRKTWVNGIAGDRVGLAIDYDIIHAAAAISASNGLAGAWTDTGDTAVLAIPAGKSVVVGEAFIPGHHVGRYTSSLSCSGVRTILGFFTMPTNDVVCTWTNARRVPTHTVTVAKTWVNGVQGDSVAVTAASADGNITDTTMSTSNGQAGSWTDSEHPATIEMPVGYAVNVAEVPAGSLNGSYIAPTMSCDGVSASGGSFTMPNNDVMCTVTNSAFQSTVTLQKEWVAGVNGDRASLTINGGTAATSTSDGNRGAVTDTQNVATATVSQGSLVNVAEALGDDNAGTYNASLTCTGGAAPDAQGSFRMPQGDVTCTYENRAHQNTLRLQKEWVNGIEGDKATYTIDNAGFVAGTTSTSNGRPGSWTDSDHAVQIPASAGSAVNLSEALGANAGSYRASLTCEGAEPDADGSFVMPDAPVTCTFSNTAVRTITLQKKWVNGIKGDTANLAINHGDPVVSTSNGAHGAWLDTENADVLEVAVGSDVSVAETVGASNKGAYDKPVLTCGSDVVPASGSFTMPHADVTCTFTNKAASIAPVVPVKPAAAIGLANTGSDATGPLTIGGMLAAIGALLAMAAWWRRRTSRVG